MAVFAIRNDLFNRRGKGLGVTQPFGITAGGAGTAAAVGSGSMQICIHANTIGSTFPGTLQTIPIPAPGAMLNVILDELTTNTPAGMMLANFYKFGTCSLTGTGNQFTHDAATFPVTRTIFGAASQPVPLIPLIQVTTALSVTAAQFKIQNATGPAAGYVNQDGTSVTGTQTFIFPSTTTALHSGYIPMLEAASGTTPGDSAVTDITAINVTVASSTGAMTVWGMEPIAVLSAPIASVTCVADTIFGAFGPNDLCPAVATAGTAVSFLGLIAIGTSITGSGIFLGAADK